MRLGFSRLGAPATASLGGTLPTASGIPSSEAFGVPSLMHQASGIPSAEAFGIPSRVYIAVGIRSQESFGKPTSTGGNFTGLAHGIPSAESFGSPTGQFITWNFAQGVPSAESFGAPDGGNISFAHGISSAEAFGVPASTGGIPVHIAHGIHSAEAFGNPISSILASVAGIPSTEAFGHPLAYFANYARSIHSGERFGVPQAVFNQTVTASGIPSVEAFGHPTHLIATGISSAEAFGIPVATGGIFTGLARGLSSAEAFGHPTSTYSASVAGIPSQEYFGVPTATLSQQVGYAYSVSSLEAFGTPYSFVVGGTPQPPGTFTPHIFTPAMNARGVYNILGRQPQLGGSPITSSYDAIWHVRIDAWENTLTFKVVRSDPLVGGIVRGAIITIPTYCDYPFKIRRIKQSRDASGILTLEIMAEAPHYDLAFVPSLYFKSNSGASIGEVVGCILSSPGCGWSAGVIQGGDFEQDGRCPPKLGPDFSVQKSSVLSALDSVVKKWGGYLRFDEVHKIVDIVQVWGNHTGITADWRVNLSQCDRTEEDKANQQILVTESASGVLTGLSAEMLLAELDAKRQCDNYLLGKLKSNGGTRKSTPCDSTSGGQTTNVTRQGDINDAVYDYIYESFLLAQAPQVSYAATVVDLSMLPNFESYYIRAGDWISVVDAEQGFTDTVRTVTANVNTMEPWKSTYEFNNAVPLLSDVLPMRNEDVSQPEQTLQLQEHNPPDPNKNTQTRNFTYVIKGRTDYSCAQGTADAMGNIYTQAGAASDYADAVASHADAANANFSKAGPEFADASGPLSSVSSTARGIANDIRQMQPIARNAQQDAQNVVANGAVINSILDNCDSLSAAGSTASQLVDSTRNYIDDGEALAADLNNRLAQTKYNIQAILGSLIESAKDAACGASVRALSNQRKQLDPNQCGAHVSTYVEDMIHDGTVELMKMSSSGTALAAQTDTLQYQFLPADQGNQCADDAQDNVEQDMPALAAACAQAPPDDGGQPSEPAAAVPTPDTANTQDCVDLAVALDGTIQNATVIMIRALEGVKAVYGRVSSIFFQAMDDAGDVVNGFPVSVNWSLIGNATDAVTGSVQSLQTDSAALGSLMKQLKTLNPQITTGTTKDINPVDPASTKDVADAVTYVKKSQNIVDQVTSAVATLTASDVQLDADVQTLVKLSNELEANAKSLALQLGNAVMPITPQMAALGGLVQLPNSFTVIEGYLNTLQQNLNVVEQSVQSAQASSDCAQSDAQTQASDVSQNDALEYLSQTRPLFDTPAMDLNPILGFNPPDFGGVGATGAGGGEGSTYSNMQRIYDSNGFGFGRISVRDKPPENPNTWDVWIDTSITIKPDGTIGSTSTGDGTGLGGTGGGTGGGVGL